MTDRFKSEALSDEELDRVDGGGLLLPAVQAAREGKRAALFFDEADAVKRKPGANGIMAQAGDGSI